MSDGRSEPGTDPAQEKPDRRDAASDLAEGPDSSAPLAGLRICFWGKLGGVTRREAHQLVRQQGGLAVERPHLPLDWLVLGADQFPPPDMDELDRPLRDAVARGELEVLSETEFWQRLGLVDSEHAARRLYTPAMLADLLQVPISIVRRWHRRGLIVPARVVHRLPYFDFQEIATARRLAEMLAAGASPAEIEKQLAALAKRYPHIERPLAQLSTIVRGRHLFLRQGEGLIDPGGQMRLDFPDDTEPAPHGGGQPDAEEPPILSLANWPNRARASLPSVPELIEVASECEDHGQLAEAIDLYRLALASGGPRADLCFHLAELLYLTGDIAAARERYAMAIELDEDYVEARANLGCVLLETGRSELARAAFQGALHSHPDYPDAHYHLARLLDDEREAELAAVHWQRFLELAPDSPWADEARERLGLDDE